MTTETIHTCSYYCERPECVRRQRDELRDRMESVLASAPPSVHVAPDFDYAGCTLWRGSLRITVVEPKSLERHVDPDQAFCDMVQRALDSLAAAWGARTSDAQQQGGRAEQPPVEGEEIMVNAGHDVFILPLQPSGLSSGPRFVVHVPGQPASPQRRPYNTSGSLSEYGILPECDAAPAAQAPRACTCHPDDRPDGPCRERYAASECQALAAQAQAANADALDAARYRWLRDREIPEWLDLWHQNPDRIDAAIDQAMKE